MRHFSPANLILSRAGSRVGSALIILFSRLCVAAALFSDCTNNDVNGLGTGRPHRVFGDANAMTIAIYRVIRDLPHPHGPHSNRASSLISKPTITGSTLNFIFINCEAITNSIEGAKVLLSCSTWAATALPILFCSGLVSITAPRITGGNTDTANGPTIKISFAVNDTATPSA